MNILELIFSPAWGGLEILVGVLAQRYCEKGHNVIGVFSPNPNLEKVFRSNNIQYKIIKPVSSYADILTAIKIKKYLAGTKIDIIHVYKSQDMSTAILLKKIIKDGKVIFAQQMDSVFKKNDFFHKWIYKNLDAVICITEGMKKNHLENTPLQSEKTFVVYNGTDLQRFNKNIDFDKQNFLKQNSIPTNRLIIGNIARLDRLKNQKLLVEVASKLISGFKDKIHFIIVGDETDSKSGKNYKNELIKIIKEKELEDHFSIFGFSDEVEKFFAIIDIFVLTTIKESFGLVLLEAMAMSKPVIASNRGGPPEIIDHGVNGLLFDPDNKEELVTQLARLISDEELRISMGEKSVEIVKNKFDLDKSVNEHLKIFKKITL